MNDEYIPHFINLYMTFHKGIPGAGRPHFADLRRLFIPVIGHEKLDEAIEKIFTEKNRQFLRTDALLALTSSVRLIGAARQLSKGLSGPEKVAGVLLLMKLLREYKQEKNDEQRQNIAVIANVLGFNTADFKALSDLFFIPGVAPSIFSRTLLLTPDEPDYLNVVDGLRYVPNTKLRLKAALHYLPGFSVVVVKIIDATYPEEVYSLADGDIFPVTPYFQKLLERHKMNFSLLSNQLTEPSPFLPYISIPPTDMTPLVILDPDKRRIELTGHCLPSAAQDFFNPIFNWVERMRQEKFPVIEIHINLSYFNTYSSKIMLELFVSLKRLELEGTTAHFIWYYQENDEELKESGEYYEEILNVRFRFVEIENHEINSFPNE